MAGYGIHRMSDGSVYQGNFHDHRRHGEGTLADWLAAGFIVQTQNMIFWLRLAA